MRDGASGITLIRPPSWRAQTFGRYCRRVGPGVLVSNIAEHTFRNVHVVDGCTNQWDLSGLPPHHVVVDISLFSRPPGPEQPETPLPLELARFEHGPDAAFKPVRRDGNDYTIRVWFGPTASTSARVAAERLIRSLEFHPPTRDGG